MKFGLHLFFCQIPNTPMRMTRIPLPSRHPSKLCLLLLILPSTITYLHFQNIITTSEVCFVSRTPTTPPNSNRKGDTGVTNMAKPIMWTYEGSYHPSIVLSNRKKGIGKRSRFGTNTIHELHNRRFTRSNAVTQKSFSEWWWPIGGGRRYPSAIAFSRELIDSLSISSSSVLSQPDVVTLVYREDLSSWCFVEGTTTTLCRTTVSEEDDGGVVRPSSSLRIFPPNGTWKLHVPSLDNPSRRSTTTIATLRVSCPASPYTLDSTALPLAPSSSSSSSSSKQSTGYFSSWFHTDDTIIQDVRKNHNLHRHRSSSTSTYNNDNNLDNPLVFLRRRPTTSLLLLLNISLAFFYWNYRTVSPPEIAKTYGRLLPPHHELWRCVTGPTAHFDIWHLAFNCMSLHSLGVELEDGDTLCRRYLTPWIKLLKIHLSKRDRAISFERICTLVRIESRPTLFSTMKKNHHHFITKF